MTDRFSSMVEKIAGLKTIEKKIAYIATQKTLDIFVFRGYLGVQSKNDKYDTVSTSLHPLIPQ